MTDPRECEAFLRAEARSLRLPDEDACDCLVDRRGEHDEAGEPMTCDHGCHDAARARELCLDMERTAIGREDGR